MITVLPDALASALATEPELNLAKHIAES